MFFSSKADAERRIMVTAEFFGGEGEDFVHYLADYFDYVTPGFPRDALEKVARDICDTYETVLNMEFEREYGKK